MKKVDKQKYVSREKLDKEERERERERKGQTNTCT